MAVDLCKHSFKELANERFPRYMESLLGKRLLSVQQVADSSLQAIVKQKILYDYKGNDMQGLYVLYEDEKPLYVGISRKLIARIRQHANGSTHHSASLAFRMARKHCDLKGSRKECMCNEEFMNVFKSMRDRIKQMSFRYLTIENDLELYLFEGYAAMELDSSEWNTFRTH